jgi:hypothetical protein
LLAGAADSVPLAGGMTLLPTIKQRLAAPTALIDLSKIPQISGISMNDGVLTIGAMTRHVEVAESEIVRKHVPVLASLAAGIGDPAVRNRGTIGGSVANNDPSADYPAAVLALDATVVTDGRSPPMPSLRGCLRPRWNRARSSPRFAFPCRPLAATPSSNRRRHATRWLESAWQKQPAKCGSR